MSFLELEFLDLRRVWTRSGLNTILRTHRLFTPYTWTLRMPTEKWELLRPKIMVGELSNVVFLGSSPAGSGILLIFRLPVIGGLDWWFFGFAFEAVVLAKGRWDPGNPSEAPPKHRLGCKSPTGKNMIELTGNPPSASSLNPRILPYRSNKFWKGNCKGEGLNQMWAGFRKRLCPGPKSPPLLPFA